MKKRYISLLIILNLLILLPLFSLASSPTLTKNHADGSQYTLAATFDDTYTNATLFSLYFELTADIFGTTTGVIVAFYDILVEYSVDGDTFTFSGDTALADINVEGGSSSQTMLLNLTGIGDPEFYITTKWTFYGNNTQGADSEYQDIWGIGRVKVKKASLAIIAPILAVLSLAYIIQKKRKQKS